MNQLYKVTVIIPIYNVVEYLEDCLESVLHQTLDGIEVLMIDNGSTDDSGKIAQRYADQYENFFYFHIPNKGLGNARNYAIDYVHGEYIIFLDSDDIVPVDAYEKMYQKAVETGNDMVIGNVRRFNSKKIYNSALHTKVFTDPFDATTIYETPQLVYDTTSWNKLIRFSFWKEHDFQFPEGILYEDIPVTMPLHFYANAVSVLDDVVYLWRARDGARKSITQNRTEIPNFQDRITIMKMVDAFYTEHVTDEQALFMKDYKWLTVDLRLYVQQLLDADDAYIDYAIDVMADYVPTFRKDSYAAIPAIDRMKYDLICQKKKERLLELLKYEKKSYKLIKIKKEQENGTFRYIGKFPFHDFPAESYDMTEELKRTSLTQKVQSVCWNGDVLTVKGYCFINRIACASKKSVRLSACLVQPSSGKRVNVSASVVPSQGVQGKYGLRGNWKEKEFSYVSYKWAGYRIDIDFTRREIAEIADGICKIELCFEMDGIRLVEYIGKPAAGKAARPYVHNVAQTKILVDYNTRYDLIVRCNRQKHMLTGLEERRGGIIFCDRDGAAEALCLVKDGADEGIDTKDDMFAFERLVPDVRYYLEEPNGARVSADAFIHSRYLPYEDAIYRISSDENGDVYVQKCQKLAVLTSLVHVTANVHLIVMLPKKWVEKRRMNELYLDILMPSKQLQAEKIPLYLTSEEGDSQFYEAVLPFSDDSFTNQLCGGEWEIQVLGVAGGETYEMPLWADAVQDVPAFRLDNYSYVVGGGELFTIKAAQQWNNYENSYLKRKVIERIIYPFLRLLPLKKKYVVFEGWWGDRFHCNPRAFYEYLQQYHPDYTCIWALNDVRTDVTGNAKKVRRLSLQYHYYMAVSKYFINNVNFADSYVKRKGQIEIQTMHGTPLKTMGLDVPGELPTQKDVDRFLRRCGRWDYLVVQSHRVETITRSCYAYKKAYLETGYPRNDILFAKNNADDIRRLKEKIGLPTDKKVIMYAPTWRVRNQFKLNMDQAKLKERLGEDYVLMLRAHPFAASGIDEGMLDDFIYNVSYYPFVEELYLVADLVITDYSSVMFDYAILNRPMLFYVYDLDDYKDTLRGFNFDFIAEAPGPLLRTADEVLDAIESIDEVRAGYEDKMQSFRRNFCEFEHGNACEQIFGTVFMK